MSAVTEIWKKFFKSCDLPRKVIERYAQCFEKERIQPFLLRDMGKDELKELGIDAIGDQLSIISYVKRCDGNPPEFFIAADKSYQSKSSDDEDMDIESPRIASRVVKKNLHAPVESSEFKSPKKGIVKQQSGTGIRVTGLDRNKPAPHGLSSRSKMIQKSVQIDDITSSVPLKSTKMRSDMISMKTMVVSETQPRTSRNTLSRAPPEHSIKTIDPEYRVNLNVKQPKSVPMKRRVVTYEGLNDFENFSSRPRPTTLIERIQRIPSGKSMLTSGIRRPTISSIRPLVPIRRNEMSMRGPKKRNIMDRISYTR